MSWAWVAAFPSTNARIILSMLLAFGTGVRVIALGWSPPLEWLGFLTAWAGLDVLQYSAKRLTDTDLASAKQGNVPSPPAVPPPKMDAAEEPAPVVVAPKKKKGKA